MKPCHMSACTKNFVTQINEIVFFQLLHFLDLNSFPNTKQVGKTSGANLATFRASACDR